MLLDNLVLKDHRVHPDLEVFLVVLVLVAPRVTRGPKGLRVHAETRDLWVTLESPVLLEQED